jgi:hypothetical protein
MTDRELWVKTCKTVGAMIGGTVLLLGSTSLLLMVFAGRPAAGPSEASGTPTKTDVGKVETVPPRLGARPTRRATANQGQPGESI